MSESKQLQKHSLECLRLEADCRQMAWNVQSPSLRSHFLRMGQVWFTMAVSGSSARAGQCSSEAETQTP